MDDTPSCDDNSFTSDSGSESKITHNTTQNTVTASTGSTSSALSRKDIAKDMRLLPPCGLENTLSSAEVKRQRLQLMDLALEQAKMALKGNEVPVGCILVKQGGHDVLARAYNQTNRKRNATRHCEFEVIDELLIQQGQDPSIFQDCDLFVTVEPCIMCASALRLINIGP